MCPSCGNEKAYVGAIEVKCPNSKCTFYDEDLRLEKAYEGLKDYEEQPAQFDPDKTPVMPWGMPEWPEEDDISHD